MLTRQTISQKPAEVKKGWVLIDADGAFGCHPGEARARRAVDGDPIDAVRNRLVQRHGRVIEAR